MSAFGQKQTWRLEFMMSALPPIADEGFLAKYQIDQANCFRFLRRLGNCHTPVTLTILIVPVSVPP